TLPRGADPAWQAGPQLPPHHKNIQERRTAAVASATFAAAGPARVGGRGGRGCGVRLRRRSWGGFGGDQDDLVFLRVQRAGFGARFGLYGLFHLETRRAGFLDNGQRSVALRTEGFHGRGIEPAVVGASANGQRGEDFAVVR